MATYNESFGITFNDNDGGVAWFAKPDSASDVLRHHKIFGRWRARWIFLKQFWHAMLWIEQYAGCDKIKVRTWVIKAEIPE